MDTGTPIKTLELDKICRVCLTVKKDMRPLFGEMIADMLMECACIQVDETDGWPDKICIQCVHQVSRCHAFKSRVEKSDQQLRQYIKGITVIVEEPITQIELQRTEPVVTHQVQSHQLARVDTQNHHIQVAQVQQSQPQPQQQQQHQQRQEIQITRNDLTTHTTEIQPQQMIINGQLHNAQIINAGQIVTTTPHHNQQLIQTTTTAIPQHQQQHQQHHQQQQHLQQQQQHQQIHQQQQATQTTQNVQLCQLVQTGNGTTAVQMIQQNGHPAQLVQIQRTGDDRCEIIVPTDIHSVSETQYYTEEDFKNLVTVTTQAMNQEEIQDDNVQLIEEIEEIEEEEEETETVFTLDLTEDEECEDKEYLAEFISMQTSCPYPGRFICNLCRKEFKHSQFLNNHMKSHSNWIKANCKKQPQCNICARSFKGPGMLKMHMKTHEHKQPEKPPKCNVCDKEFKSKTILYRHRQTHLQKNIQCGVCHKSFSTINLLQTHQSKTKHEKTIKCAHCSKVYTNENDLRVHLLTHGIKSLNQLKSEQID